MDEKQERRILRRKIGSYPGALLVYYLVLNYAVSAAFLVQSLYTGLRGVIQTDSWLGFYEAILDASAQAAENGWGYLIACCAAILGIRLWKGKAFFSGLFSAKRPMPLRAFGCFTCVFFSGQLLFQLLMVLEELLLNQLGLSILESAALASSGSDSVSMFLYMSLFAPVVEELIFRGLILRGLEPFGKRFAIVVSALLFGLFHANLVQSPYAFAVGLILAIVASEYSIGWAMVLHMLNNLLLGDTLPRLFSRLDSQTEALCYNSFFLLCALGSIWLIVHHRRAIRQWLCDNPANKASTRAFWSSPLTILFVLLMSINSLTLLLL